MAGVRQFDESAAFEQALVLFWQKGYANTTMQDLAEVTGVQRGSLYHAYGDKEAFFLKVFGVYRERYMAQMREALDKPTLRESLRGFFAHVVNSITTGTPTRGCLSTKTVVGAEDLGEPAHTAIQALVDELEGILYARLSRADKNEQLAIPPRQAARLLVTMTRGLVVIERVYRDEKRMRAMGNELITLLLGPKAV